MTISWLPLTASHKASQTSRHQGSHSFAEESGRLTQSRHGIREPCKQGHILRLSGSVDSRHSLFVPLLPGGELASGEVRARRYAGQECQAGEHEECIQEGGGREQCAGLAGRSTPVVVDEGAPDGGGIADDARRDDCIGDGKDAGDVPPEAAESSGELAVLDAPLEQDGKDDEDYRRRAGAASAGCNRGRFRRSPLTNGDYGKENRREDSW